MSTEGGSGWARAKGSVRFRVTLFAAGLFALAVVLIGVVLLRSLKQELIDDLQQRNRTELQVRAFQVAETGLPPGSFLVPGDDGSAALIALGGLELSADPVLMVVPPDLPTLDGVDTSGSIGGPPATLPAGLDVATSAHVSAVSDAEVERLVLGDPPPGDIALTTVSTDGFTLVRASSLAAVTRTVDLARRLLLLFGPLLVLLVGALAWTLAGRALRPVHALTSRVAAIGSHSLDGRVPEPRGDDEIAVLARTMNGMLARLETATGASRRLVSDASHELRTPITVMRTELEVANREPTHDWSATSEVLLGELARLQGLVDDLLVLARGDERRVVHQPLSMADLAHDVASRTRRVDVEVEAPSDPTTCEISGDETALRAALDHLVANAARHARSRVRISLRPGQDAVTVDVDDDGPGIPPADRETARQRFVRLDEGRSRDDGGAGLGLAVANDVAVLHGGQLVLDDSPFGGLRATLTVPRA